MRYNWPAQSSSFVCLNWKPLIMCSPWIASIIAFCSFRIFRASLILGSFVFVCLLFTTGAKADSCENQIRDLIWSGRVGHYYDLTHQLGCRSQSACTLNRLMNNVAKELELDPDFVKAVAYTESEWTQWSKNGSVYLCHSDYGVMQTNKPTWGDVQNRPSSWMNFLRIPSAEFRQSPSKVWAILAGDPLANIRYDSLILRHFQEKALAKGFGSDRERLARATYSLYNGGKATRAFKGHDERDSNFKRVYETRPWEAKTSLCE